MFGSSLPRASSQRCGRRNGSWPVVRSYRRDSFVNGSTGCPFSTQPAHVAIAQPQRERGVGINVRAEHGEARLGDLLLSGRDRRLHFVLVDLAHARARPDRSSVPARSSDPTTHRRPRRRRPTAPCARRDRRASFRAMSLRASDSGDSLLSRRRTMSSSGPRISRILSSENENVSCFELGIDRRRRQQSRARSSAGSSPRTRAAAARSAWRARPRRAPAGAHSRTACC